MIDRNAMRTDENNRGSANRKGASLVRLDVALINCIVEFIFEIFLDGILFLQVSEIDSWEWSCSKVTLEVILLNDWH